LRHGWRNNYCYGKTISTTYSECVCSLSYPACSAHAQYCHLAVPCCSTLFHKRHDFGGKNTEHKMCVSISSLTYAWHISHSDMNSARYYHISTWASCKVPFVYSFQILMKVVFPGQIFKKIPTCKINENPSSGSHEFLHSDVWTDRRA
jgi:hypothetical protein